MPCYAGAAPRATALAADQPLRGVRDATARGGGAIGVPIGRTSDVASGATGLVVNGVTIGGRVGGRWPGLNPLLGRLRFGFELFTTITVGG